MKKSILKLAFLLSIFIIGCSVDTTEDAVEQEHVNSNIIFDEQSDIICVSPHIDTRGYCIEYILVEYKPNMTRQEKQAIRDPYCGDMIAIELCPTNPNIEIWTVRGNYQCAKQPVLLPPSDPDLSHSVRSGSHLFEECSNQ